ncbi:MAG TPA: DUF4349 domain-containing protein [Ferruginibacter sp.]|nr:DUF4349 domain-containing protein [Ferruginibacter sp.]
MKKIKIISTIAIVIVFLGCDHSNNEKAGIQDSQLAAMGIADTVASSLAAVENNKYPGRKFIRTAELRFKVKSVIKATYDIEEITSRQEGFVTYTNLASNINNVVTVPVSEDSSVETTYHTVINDVILRVPNTRLDSTLKEISRSIDYLDYRVIKADDVALQVLSNNLAQKRAAKNETRLTNAIERNGKKLDQIMDAEEIMSAKHEAADNSTISNLSLADQVAYSTVNLSIYQREIFKKEFIPIDKKVVPYEPGFGRKIIGSLKFGLDMLEELVVFIAKLWWIILFGFTGYLVFRSKLVLMKRHANGS